jgi:hypothetical protein
MAMKWLEERWETLIPALDQLGKEQEEQMRLLCEAEKDWWRQRPGMNVVNSLRKPMTETRNHIREVLLLRDDNWWIDPKSQAKEHLALKYLNFSTEEWTQMALPAKETLQARLMQPLVLADLNALLGRGEQLLQMETWPELVLGIGLNTGRSLAEILKTGVFRTKTEYSVLFAGPMTIYEQMSAFFEVPTFARADAVLEALSRVRQMFGMQFAFVSRRDVGRQCGPLVRQVAYQHFGDLVSLRPGEQDLYKSLTRGLYACLATHLYCPTWVDEWHYMATIQNTRWVLEATSEEERLTMAIAASFLDYVLLDGTGGYDQRKGIRLGETGVDVLEVFRDVGLGEEAQ